MFPPLDVLTLLGNGSSAVAIIVVVVLFLKSQDKTLGVVHGITLDFSREIATIRGLFQSQVSALSDSLAGLNRETIRAVDRLEDAVRDLRPHDSPSNVAADRDDSRRAGG